MYKIFTSRLSPHIRTFTLLRLRQGPEHIFKEEIIFLQFYLQNQNTSCNFAVAIKPNLIRDKDGNTFETVNPIINPAFFNPM